MSCDGLVGFGVADGVVVDVADGVVVGATDGAVVGDGVNDTVLPFLSIILSFVKRFTFDNL